MKKRELTTNEISQLLFRKEVVGQGCYGLIVKYSENTLLKMYYKDYFDTFYYKDIEKLDEEIERHIKVEEEVKEMFPNRITRMDNLVSKINHLEKTSSNDLIKGIATYKNWPIGIFMEYYKDYNKLTNVFKNLNKNEQSKILFLVRNKLKGLYKNGVFPLDLKEDNILVRKRDLDVKLIDLDGDETRYEDENYIKEYPHIKREAVLSYKNMCIRLEKLNIIER